MQSIYQWWIEPFSTNPFMARALLAGLLAVLATSVAGTWVVIRGMTFLGDALAHGVMPGIAIAWISGINPLVGAFFAAMVMIAGQHLLRTYSPLGHDSSIGLLFVGFLALAVVIMSAQGGAYAGDLTRFLFGSITGVTRQDLIHQAISAAVVVLVLLSSHRLLLALTFDPVQAKLLGLRPHLAQLILLVTLALSVVSSFSVVGNLLVFAFMVAPPAAGTLLASRISTVMAISITLGVSSVVFGLLISFHYRSAAGATMALVSVVEFVIILTLKVITERFTKKQTYAPAP